VSDTLLTFERVGLRYPNGLAALADIDLTLSQGAFLALVGPSGSGKSTLLRLASRLTPPSEGAVRWAREDLRVSMVFQDATLMPWAQIADNVALPLRLAGVAREEAIARALPLLDQVGLSEFTSAYPAELSGGMKMRASLARALITNPDLLLLDEPFAALDEFTRAALNAQLLALWQEKRPAILFVTHSIFEAVYLAQEIRVLSPRPGRLIARIEVPTPYPRAETFRLSPEFAERAQRVSAAIAEGLAGRTPDAA
jgi:NitT/TauT family transport system ATP-binding protein